MFPENIQDRLGNYLGDIIVCAKNFKLDQRDFTSKLLVSKQFNSMLKDCGHRYWNFGEAYTVRDFIKTNKIKSYSKPLYDIESKWLGDTIMTLINTYKIDKNKIANNLDNILKYTEFIDYHSPEEIIKKCNLR